MFGRIDPHKLTIPSPSDALPGRSTALSVSPVHAATGARTGPPWPDGAEVALFGLGCFWGAERMFWRTPGVISTQAGYAGGSTPNPTYEEVCSVQTGHTEVVRVVFDPHQVSYGDLVRRFFENHDPTQGMRQGNDVGTQYRSAIYTYGEDQAATAQMLLAAYRASLAQSGYQDVTTEVIPAKAFYYAEDYHQQYLHKNPRGYCALRGTGVACPLPGDDLPQGEASSP